MTATLHPTFPTGRVIARKDQVSATARVTAQSVPVDVRREGLAAVSSSSPNQRGRRLAILVITALVITLGAMYLSVSHMVGSHSTSGAPVRNVAFSWRAGFDVGYADGTHTTKLIWLKK